MLLSSMMILLVVNYVATAALGRGPCDITTKAGNPCVAAHSTTRALYAGYNGPLYKVTRSSDGASANISTLSAGGFANAASQDAFCPLGDCVIAIVFDQSPQGNHLGQRHKLVNASQHKITVAGGGTFVYGMYFDPGYGYHVDNTTGIAKGNDPESIYAVMSGTHYNGRCCFDYGNSENSIAALNTSEGAGTMEAIYFGDAHWQSNEGDGDGPWVGADLECGMYYGGGNRTKKNPQSKSLPHPFVSLFLRGGSESFALKGGDATAGALQTMYDGPRPDCGIAGTCQRHGNHTYQPMSKKGAIILATGGDNSNGAMGKVRRAFCGARDIVPRLNSLDYILARPHSHRFLTRAHLCKRCASPPLCLSASLPLSHLSPRSPTLPPQFYEGIMVTGATTDATDDAVQQNIVAVKYASIPLPRATSLGCYVDKSDKEGRDLPVCATKQLHQGSAIEQCGELCASYRYFALENGKECRCGNAFGRWGKAATPSKDCDMPCLHDPTVMCGGDYFENVYSH